MPNQKSLMMEDMSVAFVQALCAANGYSISKCNHDNDGWDLSIECKGRPAEDSIMYSPAIQVQLKSSYSKIPLLFSIIISSNPVIIKFGILLYTSFGG
mgnify:CR=1 FL=1